MTYKIDDFKLDLKACTLSGKHIWVGSGYSTCAPVQDTVSGVRGCYSPPFSAPDCSLEFEIEANGHLVPDNGSKGKNDCGLLFSGAEWRPDRIVRKGTYHYRVKDELLSFNVVSELIPLTGKAGFMVKLKLKNRGEGLLSIKIKPVLKAGHPSLLPLDNWEFMNPPASGEEAELKEDGIWENNEIRISLFSCSTYKETPVAKDETYEASFAVVLTHAGVDAPCPYDPGKWEMETTEAWESRIDAANKNIPCLRSDIPGLEDYYKRSIISGLVSLWENESYKISPFPATSGIDGGGICCYPWDIAGYSAEFLTMLLKERVFDLIRLMLDSGIDRHICMSLNGVGQGWCSYSYSMWSIINFYWTAVTFMNKGYEFFDEVKELFMKEEARLEEKNNLKNYGRQHNLLEMRTSGYEYFVASPNAERAWCYDRLADIAEYAGKGSTKEWREKAQLIRKSIQDNLWDEDRGWFKCLHPDGHIEVVYSIQIFDVLRMFACNENMKRELVKHLKDGAFLGKYGVSSISAEDDEHYELNDTDWSGGGCYVGDGPNLCETLWNNSEPEMAWQILKRFFWMGEMLPYFPQEHYCDKPMVPVNKRANNIAGVAGFQSILFGMAGIKYRLDGKIEFGPHPPEDGAIEISGIEHKGLLLNLLLKPNFMKIYDSGKVFYEGVPAKIII